MMGKLMRGIGIVILALLLLIGSLPVLFMLMFGAFNLVGNTV